MAALADVYRDDFERAARQLGDTRAERVLSRGATSRWRDIKATSSRSRTRSTTGRVTPNNGPRTSHRSGSPVRSPTCCSPSFRRLLDVADRLTQNEPVDTDELISEFVYVMY
jgi:hypothetical protein